jgi:hypothetical protein
MLEKIELDLGCFAPALLAQCFFIYISQILIFVSDFCNILKGYNVNAWFWIKRGSFFIILSMFFRVFFSLK